MKKLETSHPNNEVVVSGQNDETHNNTSLSPHPPLVATNLQAIVPYDHSDNNSLADDDAAPSSDAIKRGRGRPKGSSVKKLKPNNPDDKMVIFCPSFDSMITEEEKENGNEELDLGAINLSAITPLDALNLLFIQQKKKRSALRR